MGAGSEQEGGEWTKNDTAVRTMRESGTANRDIKLPQSTSLGEQR